MLKAGFRLPGKHSGWRCLQDLNAHKNSPSHLCTVICCCHRRLHERVKCSSLKCPCMACTASTYLVLQAQVCIQVWHGEGCMSPGRIAGIVQGLCEVGEAVLQQRLPLSPPEGFVAYRGDHCCDLQKHQILLCSCKTENHDQGP